MATIQKAHPSELIREELAERGWTISDLALRSLVEEYKVRILSMEMYFAIGPTNRHCHIGADTIKWLAATLGTSEELFENLETAWRNSLPPEEVVVADPPRPETVNQ